MFDRNLFQEDPAADRTPLAASSVSIFRSQSVDAAVNRLGSPVEPLGVTNWLLAGFMALILVAAGLAAALTRYDRTEIVKGSLEPTLGDGKLVAFRPGQVQDLLVRDGERVRKGQPIVTLATDGQTEERWRTGEAIQASLSDQIAAVDRQVQALHGGMSARAGATAVKRAALQAEVRALKQARDLQAQRVRLARESLEAIQGLAEKGVGSPLQVRQRNDAVLAAEQDLASLDKQISQEPLNLASLHAEALGAEQEDLRQLAIMEQKRAELDERRIGARGDAATLVTAPIAGRVTAIGVKPGETVSAGQSLATVIPGKAQLQGVFWLPSRSIGFVRLHDSVRLKYAAYPYQKFGVARGRVAEVALAPSRSPEQADRSTESEALYRIVVMLDREDIDAYGRKWPLTAGMSVEGEIILERQSLMDWLYDNLRAIGGSK